MKDAWSDQGRGRKLSLGSSLYPRAGEEEKEEEGGSCQWKDVHAIFCMAHAFG